MAATRRPEYLRGALIPGEDDEELSAVRERERREKRNVKDEANNQ